MAGSWADGRCFDDRRKISRRLFDSEDKKTVRSE
jgi:hypothetical protein